MINGMLNKEWKLMGSVPSTRQCNLYMHYSTNDDVVNYVRCGPPKLAVRQQTTINCKLGLSGKYKYLQNTNRATFSILLTAMSQLHYQSQSVLPAEKTQDHKNLLIRRQNLCQKASVQLFLQLKIKHFYFGLKGVNKGPNNILGFWTVTMGFAVKFYGKRIYLIFNEVQKC